jgi:hypothetical protein
MKISTFLGIIVLAILLVFCKKESASNDSIIGKWKWLKSIELYSQTESNPQTAGYSLTLTFKTNDSVYYYKNDTLTSSYHYKFTYSRNNFLNPQSDSSLVLVIGSIETPYQIKHDTLVISQAYLDGPTDYYQRIH